MNQAEYENVAGGLMQLARDIEDSKRPGYTRGDDDVLINFKRVGERLGITTEQAWGTYFLKHIDAILSIMTQPDLAVSEEPAGRFADAINYLRLGYALLRERETAPEDVSDFVFGLDAVKIASVIVPACAPTKAGDVSIGSTVRYGNAGQGDEHGIGYEPVAHGHGYGVTLADGSKMGKR